MNTSCPDVLWKEFCEEFRIFCDFVRCQKCHEQGRLGGASQLAFQVSCKLTGNKTMWLVSSTLYMIILRIISHRKRALQLWLVWELGFWAYWWHIDLIISIDVNFLLWLYLIYLSFVELDILPLSITFIVCLLVNIEVSKNSWLSVCGG